jgi:hypothetical protein
MLKISWQSVRVKEFLQFGQKTRPHRALFGGGQLASKHQFHAGFGLKCLRCHPWREFNNFKPLR